MRGPDLDPKPRGLKLLARGVEVQAPASIANIGPLFDVGGIAVSYAYDRVVVELVSQGVMRVEVESDPSVPSGERNTAYHAAIAFLRDFGEPLHVRIRVFKGVPVGYGLGSSGATAAATVYALNELLGGVASKEELVPAAGAGEAVAAGEPHYDNVAASLLGGLVVVRDAGRRVLRVEVPGEVKIVLFMPCKPWETEAKTAKARRVLPRSIELRRVVEWLGAACQLVGFMALGDWVKALEATRYGGPVEESRSTLIPCYWDAKRVALESGAIGFNISGAGPTLFAIAREDYVEEVSRRVGSLLRECWGCVKVECVEADNTGARLA